MMNDKPVLGYEARTNSEITELISDPGAHILPNNML